MGCKSHLTRCLQSVVTVIIVYYKSIRCSGKSPLNNGESFMLFACNLVFPMTSDKCRVCLCSDTFVFTPSLFPFPARQQCQ